MAKLAQTSTKYQIRARINAEGIVEKPDVIGALFGQTEGLLGPELDLREMQQTGRIGRIEVALETRNGRSTGTIILPSSLDGTETALVAATLETIDRVGPCNAQITVDTVEDLRTVKRDYIINRAKKILTDLLGKIPEATTVTEQLMESVRQAEITEYMGLPAGPDVVTENNIILCEGRADVVNLLKHGVKNAVAVGGTSVPQTLAKVCQEKEVTVFLDGDRGGDLILKEIKQLADIDFVARAPFGKEVEELTKKEVFKALRDKVPVQQAQQAVRQFASAPVVAQPTPIMHPAPTAHAAPETPAASIAPDAKKFTIRDHIFRRDKPVHSEEKAPRKKIISPEKKNALREQLNDLLGTRAAAIYDRQGNFSGRVPLKELQRSIGHVSEPGALVIDGEITQDIINMAEAAGIQTIVGTALLDNTRARSVALFTMSDLTA